jgi:hypothetical protein
MRKDDYQLARRRNFVVKLLSVAEELPNQIQIETPKGAGDPRVIAYLLFLRSVSNIRAVAALSHKAMALEMRILTRCIYENLLYVERLIGEGQKFVDAMRADYSRSAKTRGEMLFERGGESFASKEIAQRLRANLRRFDAQPLSKPLSPSDMGRRGILKDAYIIYAQLSSDAGHPTIESLHRYLGARDDSNITVNPEVGGTPKEVAEALYYATNGFLGVMVGLNQIVAGTEIGKTFGALADEFAAIGHPRSGK